MVWISLALLLGCTVAVILVLAILVKRQPRRWTGGLPPPDDILRIPLHDTVDWQVRPYLKALGWTEFELGICLGCSPYVLRHVLEGPAPRTEDEESRIASHFDLQPQRLRALFEAVRVHASGEQAVAPAGSSVPQAPRFRDGP